MMIHTTKGDMEEENLLKTEGIIDNENEHTTWVEYRALGSDEVIHRSVHIKLKKLPVPMGATAASLQ